MTQRRICISEDRLAPFDRDFFGSSETASRIGTGSLGGKASGLMFIQEVLSRFEGSEDFPEIAVGIPRFVVIPTDMFDSFMELNGLYEELAHDPPDDRIASAFLRAELPAEIVGDLRGLIAAVHTPLAVRSSSLLEDDLYEPFAGVYGTKMIPNNQHDIDRRFKKLVEAIKFVYASTFFRGARDYIGMTGKTMAEEKMAVIIQEIVGRKSNDRFYPDLSGVARSYNYYPTGHAAPLDGVVDLALGLGKTIVDGGRVWTYSPAYPAVHPPVGSSSELLKRTQTQFWAVHMGKPPEHDPMRETEYLVQGTLSDAEEDGSLAFIASTYRPQDDRLCAGMGAKGPRVLTFAPLLVTRSLPLNPLLKQLLKTCEEAVGSAVEIEFAMTLDPDHTSPARFGFLQVRPMMVSQDRIELPAEELAGEGVIVASESAMGNGCLDVIEDVVYVMPDRFDAKDTGRITLELEAINRNLQESKRPYLLIGFGRWGSSDPWLGIPVTWSQISGAKAIVEATAPNMHVELSQGAHFFHNLTSFKVLYISVPHTGKYPIQWEWFDSQPEVERTEHVRHVRLSKPLTIKVDGRSGRGVIIR